MAVCTYRACADVGTTGLVQGCEKDRKEVTKNWPGQAEGI